MSAQQEAGPGGPDEGQPTEEEMRAAYEAELQRLSATDMIAQAAVSLLNIGAYRMGAPEAAEGEAPGGLPPGSGRDLEQVRDAVDAARALLEILERRIPRELGPLRDALSRLQMAYAREVQSAAAAPQEPAQEPTEQVAQQAEPSAQADPKGAEQAPEQPGEGTGPGPAEASGRLWVPGR
jgi:hypothetical protein